MTHPFPPKLIWCISASLLLTCAAPLRADEIIQRTTLGAVEVALSIAPVEKADHQYIERDAPATTDDSHRVAVTLLDNSANAPITDARVTANIAEAGYAGREQELKPVRSNGVLTYTGYFPMPGRTPYRILIHVQRRGAGRVLEAQFEYRHHH